MPPSADNLSPIVLPLAKYSYATVASDYAAPLPWTHISEHKLFAIFTTVRIQTSGEIENQQRFRIARDSQGLMMEDLDLGELARQARLGIDRMKVLKTTQSPDVHVIIRPPTIAMRFPWSNGQMHRFQIRFSQEHDYYRALSMFAAVGCPLNEAGPSSPARGAQRPASALPSIAQPREPDTAANFSRPATSGDISNIRYLRNVNQPGEYSAGAAGAPTNFEDSQAVRRMTDFEHTDRIKAPEPIGTGEISPTARLISHVPTNIGSSILRASASENLTGSQGAAAFQNIALKYTSESQDYPLPPDDVAHRATSGGMSQSPDRLRNFRYIPGGGQSYDRPSSSAPEKLPSFDYQSELATSSQQRRLEKIIYQPQPSTAPEYRSQTDMLPPRRELPFLKPVVDPKASITAKAQAEQHDLALATPDEIRRQANSQGQQSSAKKAKKAKKAPAKKAATAGSKKPPNSRRKAAGTKPKSAIPSVEELLRQEDSKFASPEKTERRNQLQDPPLLDRASAEKDAEQQSLSNEVQRGVQSGFKMAQGQIGSLPNRQGVDQGAKSTTEDIVYDSQEDYRGLSGDQNVQFQGSPEPSRSPLESRRTNPSPAKKVAREMQALMEEPAFSASSDIAKYAELEEGERRAALETFMCEQLENPAFHTLCEDMSRMWQTVFFGREVEETT